MVKTLPPVHGVWVWSLVGELRSLMTCGQKTKSWNRSSTVTTSIKTLKMVHIKKKNLKKSLQESVPVCDICVQTSVSSPGTPLDFISFPLWNPYPTQPAWALFFLQHTKLAHFWFFLFTIPSSGGLFSYGGLVCLGFSMLEAWFIWDFQCWKRFWKTGMSRLPSAEFTPSLHSDVCLNVCFSNWAFPNRPLKSHPPTPPRSLQPTWLLSVLLLMSCCYVACLFLCAYYT